MVATDLPAQRDHIQMDHCTGDRSEIGRYHRAESLGAILYLFSKTHAQSDEFETRSFLTGFILM